MVVHDNGRIAAPFHARSQMQTKAGRDYVLLSPKRIQPRRSSGDLRAKWDVYIDKVASPCCCRCPRLPPDVNWTCVYSTCVWHPNNLLLNPHKRPSPGRGRQEILLVVPDLCLLTQPNFFSARVATVSGATFLTPHTHSILLAAHQVCR